jgi:EmrB/QacA subfamily drug resistance transporter
MTFREISFGAIILKTLPTFSQLRHFSFQRRVDPSLRLGNQGPGWNEQSILPWLMVPLLMMVINISMFGVALPTIRNTFAIQADVTAWLVTAYMLPFMIFMPLYGRLSDGLGKRRLFLTGLAVFLVGTVMTLLATDLRMLMLGRAVQGLGASGINPLCIAIISELFPSAERGKALGTWNSIGPVAGMAAPFMGGFLIDHVGWRTIFGPVLLACFMALYVIRDRVPVMPQTAQPGYLRAFDWGGVVLLSLATTLLVFFLSSRPITGVAALHDWRLLTVGVLLFGSFIFWERRQRCPFVKLDIFANKTFSRASICAGIRMFTMSGIGFLIPLYLTDVHHLSAGSTGLVLMLHAGALLVTMRVGGQWADRLSNHWPIMTGLLVQSLIMTYFALLPGTASLTLVIVGVVGHGLGAGLSLAAMHRSSMSKIPQNQSGAAAGLYSMIRFAGTVMGTALGGVLLQTGLDWSMGPVEAYQLVFSFTAGVALSGVVIGWSIRE